jgi:hypothetical protein
VKKLIARTKKSAKKAKARKKNAKICSARGKATGLELYNTVCENMIIPFHNRKQRKRDREDRQRGRDRGQETER